MNQLENVINIGSVLAEKLKMVNINSIEDLQTIGAKEAVVKMHNQNIDICINTLNALQGAVEGIRWHQLDKQTKKDLLQFYKTNFL